MKPPQPFKLFSLLLLGLLILGANLSQVRAQDITHAGLVVQYGDGTLKTYCIPLEGDDFTGSDLLEASGLQLETTFDPTGGAAVCKIEDQGCPKDDCFCEGDTYWSYWNLKDGGWEYSQMGSSSRILQPGDVDGWRWSQGDQPPVISFDQICGSSSAQTSMPTNTPTFTSTPTLTSTPTQTNTSQPTPSLTSTSPSSYPGPQPTATSVSAYPGPQPTATSVSAYPGPQNTTAAPSASPQPQATASPLPEASPSPESAETSASPTPPPAEAIPLEIVTQPSQTELPTDTPAISTPSPVQPEEEESFSTAGIEMGLLIFGILTILLGAGLLVVLYRQGML
ncbi:MAG: hypothetical protein PVG14_18145 [Anaerolineales bacterium]